MSDRQQARPKFDAAFALRMHEKGVSIKSLAALFQISAGSLRVRLDMADTRGRGIVPAVKVIPCLACERSFESTWIGNRICDRCKETDVWVGDPPIHSIRTAKG